MNWFLMDHRRSSIADHRLSSYQEKRKAIIFIPIIVKMRFHKTCNKAQGLQMKPTDNSRFLLF